MQFSSYAVYVCRVLKRGERLVHSPPSFFQLTIWKALIKLHIFYYVGITSELLTRKLYLLSPVARETEKRGGGKKDKKAERMRWRTSKREKASMKEKKRAERGRRGRKGEAGWKIGGGVVAERGCKHPWESTARGVLGWGPEQGGRAAPRSCWLFKKSRVLNLSLCCL